jgi:glycosyltransferase involved in cell wall biosynthesis
LASADFWKGVFLDWKRENLKVSKITAFKVAWGVFAKSIPIARDLKKIKKELGGNIVLYSYWLDENAIAAVQVEEKVNIRAHGWDVYEYRHQIQFLPFRRWLSEKNVKLFCISKNGLEYIKTGYKFSPQKLKLAYLGTNRIHQKTAPHQHDAIHVVSCASIIVLKRIELIVDLLAECDVHIYWTHIGGGAQRANTESYANKKLANKTKIKYEFIGHLSNTDVKNYYAEHQIDIFVSMSSTEGLPVSMMEAQSVGIPILSTDVGGVREIVLHEVNGWLLDPKNPLPQAINYINQYAGMSVEQKNNLRGAAKNHWEQNFSAETNYKQFVRCLTSDT